MAQWYPPIAALKQKEEAWAKIESMSWSHPKQDLTKRSNYFNNKPNYEQLNLKEYDLYFAFSKMFPLWDPKKIKDNRPYLPKIRENIFSQEKNKPVPALTSLNYGRPCRPAVDILEVGYRKANATGDFYRKRGVMKVIERKAV